MAKTEQLIFDKGRWKGKQIVSEKWVGKSTTPKSKITGIDYGYLWWNIPYKVNKNTIVSKTATGNRGQFIMVIPEMDMVAAFTGGAYNSQEDKLAFAVMKEIFLPLFTSRK